MPLKSSSFPSSWRRYARHLRDHLALATVTLCLTQFASRSSAQDLKVTFGSKGIQTLSYRGVLLEDVGANSNDLFHIWHMRSTDIQGNARSDGAYGWGETNNGEYWDAGSKTETYTFPWGSIATKFVQNGNNLDMIVTESNNSDSGIIFDGAEIYPVTFHFPQEPASFYGYSQYAITTTEPGVSAADFGSGVVTSVIPDETAPMYGGWKSFGGQAYTPLMTTTAPDGLATFLPKIDRAVQPGASFTYTVSLRFTPEGTSADASDAYKSFANMYPSQMTWNDHRMIGTAYLASSPTNTGDVSKASGFPTNPRRYFNDPSVDITTSSGLQAFQQRMLAQASANAKNAQAMNAQGVITWDIEGEQFPQSTSYVCSPDQIASVAPEMESTIADSSSGYAGQKLDDAYFAIMRNSGVKVGVCLRPQSFRLAADGTANQVYLKSNGEVIANLENKAKYANSRWGATIFYVDSSVDATGGTLDPAIFQQITTDMPSFLFIPEESTPRYYAYTAPFYSFLFHNDLGTPNSIYNVYPNAFGANLVNDVSALTLASFLPQLTRAASKGDILMGHADYWQANDSVLTEIYNSLGIKPPTILKAVPAVSWLAPPPISYGTPLSATQLNATSNVSGTFTFSPGPGTILNAGMQTLLATFTPNDSQHYSSTSTTVSIAVKPATPNVTWATPSAVTYGTGLSGAQLDATANVPGSFSYTPSLGTVLPVGNNTLTALFTPSDSTNYMTASSSISLTVQKSAQTKPNLSWISPAPITYGDSLTAKQLNAAADVPGTFTYNPGAGTVLNAGANIIQVSFTPTDSGKYTAATTSSVVTVQKATPSVSWNIPAVISAGSPLSSAQLNATSNVTGRFIYAPSAGAVLAPGASTLTATFVPSDLGNYNIQTSSVAIQVQQPNTPINLSIAFPQNGATVAGSFSVIGDVRLFLDAAGTFLIVDGQWLDSRRVTDRPYLYALDTTHLSNGPHTLQLWGHDIGNNTTLSPTITINVANP